MTAIEQDHILYCAAMPAPLMSEYRSVLSIRKIGLITVYNANCRKQLFTKFSDLDAAIAHMEIKLTLERARQAADEPDSAAVFICAVWAVRRPHVVLMHYILTRAHLRDLFDAIAKWLIIFFDYCALAYMTCYHLIALK